MNNLGQVSNVAVVHVSITGAAPVAVNDVFSLLHGTTMTFNILANDTDADNDINPASVVIITQPTQGTLTVNANGTVTYVSTGTVAGSDTFSYTVKDTEGLTSNIATVMLTIT
jgi:hypothetical protein